MPDILSGTITITGLSDLEKKLEQFTDRIAKNILGSAIRAGAVVIQKEAKQICPESAEAHLLKSGKGRLGTWIAPGTLKKGIRVRMAPRKSRDVPITYWVYVQRNLYYWKFVEFGTEKMAAHPFMRPGFDTKKMDAVEAIRDYLAQRIEKEAEKNGG
jgi:HK97 gp10 family phage protein